MSDIENLIVSPISKASARQRAGRAGRVRPYRLYTEEYFTNEMPAEGIPEIQRSNLMSSVIQLKALGIDNILGFHWPASPSPESLIRALEVLYSLGVFDDDAKLTSPTGFQVAEVPLTFSSYSLSAFCFKSMTTFLVLFSIGELLVFSTQAPVNYINLQCLKPSLRPLSMAMSTVAIHIFSDVPSSPLVGVLEDQINIWRSTSLILTSILFITAIIWSFALQEGRG